jgi:hypothetical protein
MAEEHCITEQDEEYVIMYVKNSVVHFEKFGIEICSYFCSRTNVLRSVFHVYGVLWALM